MIKRITLLFICFLAFQANAQVSYKPGVRAGLNFSNLTDTDFDTRTDFYVGGLLAMKMSRFYTFQPEITYSRQGAKAKYYDVDYEPIFGGPSEEHEKNYSFEYLSLGIMNKFTFGPGFNALIGVTGDIKVGDNVKGRGKKRENPIDYDLAFMAGIGYTLPMGLTIEARYKKGLFDVFGYYFDGNDICNSVFQVGLAYPL